MTKDSIATVKEFRISGKIILSFSNFDDSRNSGRWGRLKKFRLGYVPDFGFMEGAANLFELSCCVNPPVNFFIEVT